MNRVRAALVPDDRRASLTAALFGVVFPLRLEPYVYSMAERLAPDYRGGYWHFYALSNGGFYMAPDFEADFQVRSENGFDGQLSADALGLASCLYAYSHLSFVGNAALAERCAQHYHLLRDYVLGHREAGVVLRAID